MKRIVIIGASGFGREIAWAISRINGATPTFEMLGFCDDAESKRAGMFGGYALLGVIEEAARRFGRIGFFCAIGDNRARQAVTRRAVAAGWEAVTLMDPGAAVAPDVEIGQGCYMGIGSVVSAGARLGHGVIVNYHATVGHDARVGDFAHLCPGSCLSGGSVVGEGALMGTLAGTIPLKQVGDWAIVGAGAVALQDVAAGATLARMGARRSGIG